MYATVQDLNAYMGKTVADADRLLNRANELIKEVVLDRVETDIPTHVEAAKNATCAQVEYWLMVGEDVDIIGPPKGFQVGAFSMQGELPRLAPRALRYLKNAGLMYRGVMQGTRNTDLARTFFRRSYL